MQILYIIIALAILGGGYYFITESNQSDPAGDTSNITGESEDSSGGTRLNDEELEARGETASDDPNLIGGDAEVSIDADPEIDTGVGENDTSVEVDASTHVFNVSGMNFAFNVKEMRVKEGDTVTINFESSDGFHDWVIDEFDAATDQVRPGSPTSVTFVADKAGTFEYYCSVGNHRAQGMVGALIVE